MLQRVVHGRVVRYARIVTPHEVVEAAERAVLHPHRAHDHDVRLGERFSQQQRRVLQVPFDVVFVVPIGFHLFRDVLERVGTTNMLTPRFNIKKKKRWTRANPITPGYLYIATEVDDRTALLLRRVAAQQWRTVDNTVGTVLVALHAVDAAGRTLTIARLHGRRLLRLLRLWYRRNRWPGISLRVLGGEGSGRRRRRFVASYVTHCAESIAVLRGRGRGFRGRLINLSAVVKNKRKRNREFV